MITPGMCDGIFGVESDANPSAAAVAGAATSQSGGSTVDTDDQSEARDSHPKVLPVQPAQPRDLPPPPLDDGDESSLGGKCSVCDSQARCAQALLQATSAGLRQHSQQCIQTKESFERRRRRGGGCPGSQCAGMEFYIRFRRHIPSAHGLDRLCRWGQKPELE